MRTQKDRGLCRRIPSHGIDRTHCAAPRKRYDWHLDLSPETMSAFRAAPTLADQKQLLQSYIREIIQFPLTVLDQVAKG